MATKLTRGQKKARTRERLLDAAAAVFAEEGYQAASLDDVAARADLTKGAIYSNFDSKEDLFFALIQRGLPTDFGPLLDESVPLVDRFVEFARRSARMTGSPELRDHTKLELEFALLSQRDKRARALVRDIHRDTRRRLGAFLQEQARREGIHLPMDAEPFAEVLLATVRGLMQQRSSDPRLVTEDLIAEAVRLLFASS